MQVHPRQRGSTIKGLGHIVTDGRRNDHKVDFKSMGEHNSINVTSMDLLNFQTTPIEQLSTTKVGNPTRVGNQVPPTRQPTGVGESTRSRYTYFPCSDLNGRSELPDHPH